MLSPSMLIAIAAVGFIVFLILFVGTLRSRYAAQTDDRLQSLVSSPQVASANAGPTQVSTDLTRRSEGEANDPAYTKLLGRLVPDSKTEQHRQRSRMFQAGIYHPSALGIYFASKVALMIVPPMIGAFAGMQGFISLRTGLIYGGIVGALGMILPSIWLDHRIAVRHKHLKRSLPDFLDLMIVCLDGGLSLQGAIQRVSDEFQLAHPELALEMQTIQRDVNLGAPVETALRNLADRTGLDSLKTLSTFLRESMKFGTEMSEALRQHGEMLRPQREQAAEEQAQRAAVHILLPTLLLILPAVFVVVAGPAAIQIQEAFAKRSNK